MNKQIKQTLLSLLLIFTTVGCLNDSDGGTNGCNVQVYPDDYTITDRASLNALTGYSEVTGGLRIRLSTLTNLDGLECLTSVGENLSIDTNLYLTSLHGLKNLTLLGGI